MQSKLGEMSNWCSFVLSSILLNTLLSMLVGGGNLFVRVVDAHGRMIDPAARGSMWRFGFNVPENYNDMSNYCGGIIRQWEQNGGKCGVCGVC